MSRFVLTVIMVLCSAATCCGAVHRALVLGLGKQLDTRWAKINGDNDIHYVVNMLQDMGFTDIATLRNEQATKANMVKAFKQLAARCKQGDIVYIHYSGHGQLMTDLDGDEAMRWTGRHSEWDESWIPYDAYMTYCPQDRGERHFSDDEVAMFLQQIRRRIGSKGQLIVAIDACHSGDATCGDNDECVRGVDIKFNIPRQPGTPSAKPIKEQWLTISACKPYQLSSEVKGKRVGKLSYALYTLGKKTMNMSRSTLEKRLADIFCTYESRIRQTPMVTGRK